MAAPSPVPSLSPPPSPSPSPPPRSSPFSPHPPSLPLSLSPSSSSFLFCFVVEEHRTREHRSNRNWIPSERRAGYGISSHTHLGCVQVRNCFYSETKHTVFLHTSEKFAVTYLIFWKAITVRFCDQEITPRLEAKNYHEVHALNTHRIYFCFVFSPFLTTEI